jgi:serine/threonine protein kinase
MAAGTEWGATVTNRIADYELLHELGHGNFGVFYLAHPPERLGVTDEFVAIKVFGSGTRVNSTTFRHAVAELKAFAAVESPYLVQLIDAGQERGVFYYSMEYLPLGSLADPSRQLTREESLNAIADAAQAAHDLHETGIVHRDIKPGNILLHEQGGRLSDLGLAQTLAPGLTVTSFGGAKSLEYLDPAVLRGARPSRASDIWALGVTLHIALTGIGVYPKLHYEDVLLAMRTVASNTPVLRDDLHPKERALVTACLSPALADRPRTALEVAQRIAELSGLDAVAESAVGDRSARDHRGPLNVVREV